MRDGRHLGHFRGSAAAPAASPTPWSILKLAEVIEDVVPPGLVNVVNGPGAEIGKALASNPRSAKISVTGRP